MFEATVFALYLLLAIALTWPLANQMTTTVSDLGDPLLNTFIINWDCYALTHQPLHLFDAPFFYPSKYPLAYSEHLVGIALLCLPFYLLGFAPVTVYNIAMLIGFALSAYGGYVLARVVTGRLWPSVLAGILYGFIPYKFGHLSHLQIISSGWLPLMLAALLVYRRSPSMRNAALFAGAFAMSGLTNIYYLLFGSVAIALTIALIAIAESHDRRFWLRLGGALFVATLVLLPFLIPYKIVADTYEMKRTAFESEGMSATWTDWLVSAPNSRLYGRMTDETLRHSERWLFPGLLIVLLSAAAFFLTPRREKQEFSAKSLKWLDALIVLLSIATFFCVISPKYHAYIPAALLSVFIVVRLVINGRLRSAIAGSRFSLELWVLGLWIVIGVAGSLGMHAFFHSFLFHNLEPFRATRVPARWAMIAYAGLGGWAAAGASMWRRRWVPPLLFALALVDVWPRIRWEHALVDPPAVDRWLAQTHAGPLLELPIHRLQGLYFYMLRSTTHHVPMFDGLSGFEPPLHRFLREQPLSDATYALLERNGCRYVLVRTEWFGGLQPLAIAWLQRGMAQGRLAFVRRFDGGVNGDYLFTLTRVERNWQRFCVPSDDVQLARMLDGQSTYSGITIGQLYQPAPWSEVKGPMTVSGWAMSPFGLREVNVLIDNGRIRIPTGLFARADVTETFPWYPQTPRPAFALRIPRRPRGVPVETDVQIEIVDGRGQRTMLPDVLVVWR